MEKTSTHKAIYARVQAKTRSGLVYMHAGTWVGMTSSPMPAWSAYGRTAFATLEEARNYIKALEPRGYKFEVVPGTAEFYEETVTTVTVIETRVIALQPYICPRP